MLNRKKTKNESSNGNRKRYKEKSLDEWTEEDPASYKRR